MPADTTTVVFDGSLDIQPAILQRVFLREFWTDPWEEQQHLYCLRAKWTTAPEIGTAVLYYTHGQELRPGSFEFEDVERLDVLDWFVKVEFTDGTNTWLWYGRVKEAGQLIEGTVFDGGQGYASGKQQLTCYGLESLLDEHIIRTSFWFDSSNFDEGTIDRGLTFNAGNQPNRSDLGGEAFEQHLPSAQYWSTQWIVWYLLKHQVPDNGAGLKVIEFEASQDTLLEWDRPVLNTDGRTTRELLNSVLSRHRGWSYYLTVDEDPVRDKIILHPFNFHHGAAIDVGDGDLLIPNGQTVRLVFDRDPTARATLRTTLIDRFHRCEARGARRRTCFTVGQQDSTLEAGYSSDLKDEYNDGASNAADYPSAGNVIERQRRNDDARAQDRLAAVYSRFILPADWDFTAGDGLGNIATLKPVFPDDDDETVAVKAYLPELRILPTLPLLERHDYDDTNIADETVTTTGDEPYEELRPFGISSLPNDATRYVQIDQIAAAADASPDLRRRFSVMLRPDSEGTALWLNVIGDHQHVIADTEFVAADSSDPDIATWDWQDMAFTIAVEDDRVAKAIYPEDPGDVQAERVLVINAGDVFRLDYVVPNTIVAVQPDDGSLHKSTGGYVRDDRPQLERIARLGYEWYKDERQALDFSTGQFKSNDWQNSGFWLGNMVLSIGDRNIDGTHQQDVNSVVTSVDIEFSVTSGGTHSSSPRVTYATAFGSLDPLKVLLF